MRVRRVPFTVAVTLAAGLALTACSSGNGPAAAAPPTGAAATATGGNGAGTGAGGTGAGGGKTSPAAGASTAAPKGGSPTAAASSRCTAADLEISILGPAVVADDKQPAYAAIHVVNVSGRTCTLTGFPGVQVTDDAGRSAAPLTADRRSGAPAMAVVLKPKQLANANLEYSNVNSQASASGRRVCAVTSSKAQVILPDETQTKQVNVSGGVDNGTLNICGPLTVQAFEGVPGANG